MSGSLSTPVLRRTALYPVHRELGAKMVDFGGCDMPVEYSGITAEHMAVRTAVGLFDVSHMGDIQFRGPGSLAAIQAISMNDASKLSVGQAQYSAMLYPQGTFVDDILVHKFSDNDYLLVINAGTRAKDYQWIRSQVGSFAGVHISDYSDYYTQLAIQGPRAQELVDRIAEALPLSEPVPCHNDLLAGNLIEAGDQLLLVDWEYAGLGHRYFDLGNLAVNNGFDEVAERLLLEAYFEEPGGRGESRLAALRLFRLVSDAREAAWGVVQGLISALDFDFAAYADEHFERLDRAASDTRNLEELLNAASP